MRIIRRLVTHPLTAVAISATVAALITTAFTSNDSDRTAVSRERIGHTVSKVEDASGIAGFPIGTPKAVPEGFSKGNILVFQPAPPGKGSTTIWQSWSWQQDPKVVIKLFEVPGADALGGAEPFALDGFDGQRLLITPEWKPGGTNRLSSNIEYATPTPRATQIQSTPTARRMHTQMELFWQTEDSAYVLSAPLTGPLTEDVLIDMALSVSRG